ncbi:hypothetical protein R1sor_001207 [Riccia sorocarpa]|uniref:Uncharacterized protein n=1 Tax=Riccia sorocarpa TaxID=122646 RepID=A0ABD3GYK6_9MARC
MEKWRPNFEEEDGGLFGLSEGPIRIAVSLVFEYMFGRGLFGRSQRLIDDGTMIARDMTWMAFKTVMKEGNLVAFLVVIACLFTYGT